MAGIRWPPEDSDLFQGRPPAAAGDLVSDDERSIAADSWSIKSDYGSTFDDEQRHVDASEVLSSCNYSAASDYSSDKDAPDANEVETSVLGLQSFWDGTYAEDLANFHEHGHAGEVWFGVEVMNAVTSWTQGLCTRLPLDSSVADDSSCKSESSGTNKDLSSWNVLDIGTGNGLLLQELAKQGFSNLTGIDYSEGAIELARNLAVRNGFSNINFMVDDVLETKKVERKFQLVMDKGTLDAIGLHPDGLEKRMMYWESVSNLVASGGILVITSCNSTKDELVQEVENFNQRKVGPQDQASGGEPAIFQYLDHVKTYPSVLYGGVDGSRVATVAFVHKMLYWESVSNLVASGGILVITSCNSTKDELVQEVENFNQRKLSSQDQASGGEPAIFQYLDHVKTYPSVLYGGVDGSRVATVAFVHK